MQQLNLNDAYHFTTTPALASACKQYFVNFESMWSHDQYRHVLRVCITLLHRINLVRSRLFDKKKYEAKKIDDFKKSQVVSKKFKAKKSVAQKMEVVNQVSRLKIRKNAFTDCTIPPYYNDRKCDNESPGVVDGENKDEHEEDYNIFNSEGDTFTSVHDIKDSQDKQFVFKNFFDWRTVDRIMKEQKMASHFYYSNRYDLQFVGLKKSINKDLQKTPIINQEQHCLVIDNSQIEKEIKQLNDAIEIQKKEYAALGKSIRVEEWNRMNLGRSFRAKEKYNHPWDTKLYKQLKEKRSDCDNIYS
ncbi:hypothetical protein INT47_009201 [Mucor saturninus]|uniref:Uncharacterized protein n=1 Tax=Mucor saturninus TaxID=64648 RepID=A0A8H7RM13_9FUNG|nr:hypothetical protein INT47_009201 [Mucor saturninus]